MENVNHQKTPEGPAESVHSTAQNGDQRIPLATIFTCELNPRAMSNADISGLAADIEQHGLLQPVTLNTTEDGGLEVVLGTRRLRAITKIRGEDGVLEPGEYQIVSWTDEQCLKNALAENEQREGISAYEAGSLLNYAMSEMDGMTDAKLAELTGLGDRGAINEYRDLARHFELLPTSWQSDLKKPMVCSSDDKAAITRTHFKHMRGRIENDAIPADVFALMEQAATERWSTAKFKEALDNLNPTPKAKKPKAALPSTPQVPVEAKVEAAEAPGQSPEVSDQPVEVPGQPTKVADEQAKAEDLPEEGRTQPPTPPAPPLNPQHDDAEPLPQTPTYARVLQHLTMALSACALLDRKIANQIQDIINLIPRGQVDVTPQDSDAVPASVSGDDSTEPEGKAGEAA